MRSDRPPESLNFGCSEMGRKGAPVIVFLHGFLGSKQDWATVMPRLGPEFFCIALDLPGHGNTKYPVSGELRGMRGCAGAIIKFLDSKSIDVCHLVGYSMGGRLALYLAIHHPDRIRKVVVESGSPGLNSKAEREARRHLDNQLADRLESGRLEEFLRDWYGQPLFHTLRRKLDAFNAMVLRRLNNDAHGLARSLREMGTGVQPSLWPLLSRGRHPLLLLVGAEDRKFLNIAKQIAELYPDVQLRISHGCGHSVHLEDPKFFAKTLKCFLKQSNDRQAVG